MYAAANGHVQCVKTLLQAGAGVNTVSWHGRIALNYAMDDGCVNVLVNQELV